MQNITRFITRSLRAALLCGVALAVKPATAATTYYIAPGGSDSNACTQASPCATLQGGIAAVVAGGGTVLQVGGGAYAPTATLSLGTADNGFAIQGDGTMPVFSCSSSLTNLISMGGSSVTITGLEMDGCSAEALLLNGATSNTIKANRFVGNNEAGLLENGANNNTIQANTVLNSTVAGFEIKNQSTGNLIGSTTNSAAGYALGNYFNGISTTNDNDGAIYCHGANNTTFSHNYVTNVQGSGLSMADFDNSDALTENTGAVITYNTIVNACLGSTDCGSIYIVGRSLVQNGDTVSNNYVDGTGPSNQHSVGIYLDDNASGITVSNNFVRTIGTDSFQVHGGSNDTITRNVFDLGTGSPSAGYFQSAGSSQPNSNNGVNTVDSYNVFITESSGPKSPLIVNDGTFTPTYTGNTYYSTTGVALNVGS